MPDLQSTDGGCAEGEDSVSSVSLELMSKDGAGRRIQGIRIMQSKPEKLINEILMVLDPLNGPRLWSHGPPGTPTYGASLALGDSNNPHRPQIIGNSKDQKD
ncbi:hypothetical protein O181_016061 [Austropuccinia psidii MF-1]|uniref:Uncharacterized protein n=1 Tax=Austropuccinia psidii MF-1 TaxID=1389203 RepID=A0A9Q3C4W7_9BASI|nr:hypothetical protein [Austropuccinia psidii MF-1]